jgi:hypothetical protein
MAHALGCRFVELPGVGHMSTIEAPDMVNAQLLAFFDEACHGENRSAARVGIRVWRPEARIRGPVTSVVLS